MKADIENIRFLFCMKWLMGTKKPPERGGSL